MAVLICTQSFLILSRTNRAADIIKFSILASSMLQILMRPLGQDRTSLSQLLYLNRLQYLRMLASNPQDRIFRFIGFANDVAELGINPDYSQSCVDVYTDVARAFLKAGDLEVLSWRKYPRISEPPSWASDLSEEQQQIPFDPRNPLPVIPILLQSVHTLLPVSSTQVGF